MVPNASGLHASAAQSRGHQEKDLFDFEILQRAKPMVEEVYSYERLYEMGENEIVNIAHHFARQGLFLPLSHWSVIIEKFSKQHGFANINEVEKLYQLIKKKYPGEIYDLECKAAWYTHSAMMRVYICRQPQEIAQYRDKIFAIYESYKHPWIYNGILLYFLRTENFSSTIAWFKEWPFATRPNGSAYQYYLQAVKRSYGDRELATVCDLIDEPDLLHDVKFVTFYMEQCLHPSQLKAVLDFYKQLPQEVRVDRVCQTVIRAYMHAAKVKEAIDFFNSWPVSVTTHTYTFMIQHVSETDIASAYDILERALKEDKCYQQSVRVTERSPKKMITIDLSRMPQMWERGVERDFSMQVIKTMVGHLVRRRLAHEDPKQLVAIDIVAPKNNSEQLYNSLKSDCHLPARLIQGLGVHVEGTVSALRLSKF